MKETLQHLDKLGDNALLGFIIHEVSSTLQFALLIILIWYSAPKIAKWIERMAEI